MLLVHASHHIRFVAHFVRHERLQVLVPPLLISSDLVWDVTTLTNNFSRCYGVVTIRLDRRVQVGPVHKVSGRESWDASPT